MDRNEASQRREMVYCHECENEWYRDEHGLTCPECQSDFTEFIDPSHDPRVSDEPMPTPGAGPHEWFAPDPEEDDIDRVGWQESGTSQNRGGYFPGAFWGGHPDQQQQPDQPQRQQQSGFGGGLMGLLGSAVHSAVGGGGGARPQQIHTDTHRSGSTYVRHTSGPGFSVTFASSSSPGLSPRNPHGAQPFQQHPAHIEQLISQMFMNIGATPMHGQGGRGGFGGPLFINPGGPGLHPLPVGDIFQLLRAGSGGAHGDAVYSQEALDRIMTQLMEQHSTGNAPGPASAEAIAALPTKQISVKEQGESAKAECSICMDEAALGTTVTVLPCGHWFHGDCIKAWLTEHDTCPHCRQGIMPQDGAATASGSPSRPRQPDQPPLHHTFSQDYHHPHPPGSFPPAPQQFYSPNADGNAGPQQYPGGDRQSSWPMPSSPPGDRRSSSRQGSSSGNGVFSRMRQAFGGDNAGGGGAN